MTQDRETPCTSSACGFMNVLNQVQCLGILLWAYCFGFETVFNPTRYTGLGS